MSGTRTFIVRVSGSPSRVVVEDVRRGVRVVAGDLAGVGAQIEDWLETTELEPDQAPREDSVSPAKYGRPRRQGKP